MLSAIRSVTHPLSALTHPALLARNFTRNHSCNCSLSTEEMTKSVATKNFSHLRGQAQHCKLVQEYKMKWQSYEGFSTIVLEQQKTDCRLANTLEMFVQPELSKQTERVTISDDTIEIPYSFAVNAFASKPKQVTLAGEAGAIVEKTSYWDFALHSFDKERPVQVISIGGAEGFDAKAINDVFTSQGFVVARPIVVDPNPIAAFLSEEQNTKHYVTTSKQYFSDFFEPNKNYSYIFHLGTTLNVVSQGDAPNILQEVVSYMQPNDALSLLLVDKEQFRKVVSQLTLSESGKEGFAEYKLKQNNKHYKTVINDKEKFINFVTSLGLKGEFKTSIKEGHVLFIAYKSLKA